MGYNIIHEYTQEKTVLIGDELGGILIKPIIEVDISNLDHSIKCVDMSQSSLTGVDVYKVDRDTLKKFKQENRTSIFQTLVYGNNEYWLQYSFEPNSKLYLLEINMVMDSLYNI